QQLVDITRSVLGCCRVTLVAFGAHGDSFYYAVGSGCSSEQEQVRRETCKRFLCSDFVDKSILQRLNNNEEVIFSADRLNIPPGFPADLDAANFLVIPLFVEQQMAGALAIAKAGIDTPYLPEEIDLVRAVASQAVLIIECLRCLREEMGVQA